MTVNVNIKKGEAFVMQKRCSGLCSCCIEKIDRQKVRDVINKHLPKDVILLINQDYNLLQIKKSIIKELGLEEE